MKYLAPTIAWTTAIMTLAGAANALRHERIATDSAAVLAAVPHLQRENTPLSIVDYQGIQKKIVIFGAIGIEATPEGLIVTAKSLADYAAWRLTIDRILLDSPGIHWRIDTLCSGKCPTNDAHRAIIVGSRLSAKL